MELSFLQGRSYLCYQYIKHYAVSDRPLLLEMHVLLYYVSTAYQYGVLFKSGHPQPYIYILRLVKVGKTSNIRITSSAWN